MKPSRQSYPSLSHIPFKITLLFVTLLSWLAPLSAQDLDNVSITGRVVDQNGAVVAGATVAAVLNRTSSTRIVTVDTGGRFNIRQLEAGMYTLTVTAVGFAPFEKGELILVAGQAASIEATLFPQGLAIDPITIDAGNQAPIDTTRTVVGGTLTTLEIETLPIPSRSPLDLLITLPGITEEPLSTRELAEDRDTNAATSPEEAGIFAVAGGPAYSNNLTIDGLDNNDDRAARERFQPSLEAVEEVQVITNQFAAEYGRASGGRVNIKTRGGAQSFAGGPFSSSRMKRSTPTLSGTTHSD